MKKLLSCRFNIDTASVEIRYTDGSQISIYTPGADDELCLTVPMQTEIDWLIYNEPMTYAWCSLVNWSSMPGIWREPMV
ncbi:MAG: DUF6061 family protein [Clostridiales bacterium]|nr:DUF6061 family protein [Clostridiales bacterium]